MIPARRAYLAITIALTAGTLAGRFSVQFETIALIAPLGLMIILFALLSFVDAGKPKQEPAPDPFRQAADEP